MIKGLPDIKVSQPFDRFRVRDSETWQEMIKMNIRRQPATAGAVSNIKW